ncbi:MAG: ABC transporter permease [Candidatus Micrarchaeia archaeon]
MRFVSAMIKELQEISHDRTMLSVLIAFPILVMVFMGSSFRSMEISGLPIGLTGPTNTTLTSPLFAGLNESKAFNLKSYGDEQSAISDFHNGLLRAVIIVPEDFDRKLLAGNGSTVRIIVDNSDLALEQSILAAMGSVIQASSANITRSYVSGAWRQLEGLNKSAGSLATDVNNSRMKMLGTKATLAGVREGIDNISIGSLEGSISEAQLSIAGLKATIDSQKAELKNASEGNAQMINRTRAFVANASDALNRSIATVGSTHDKLKNQTAELNSTINVLDASIAGLETIKAASPDNTTKAALDLNIASLSSLRNATQKQMTDAIAEIGDLESLNTTLIGFSAELGDYSAGLDPAEASLNKTAGFSAALENVSSTLDALEGSFAGAKTEVGKLKSLLSGIKNTTGQIDATMDDALNQTRTVDSLISSLQETVAEQTGRDPDVIASPLSVKVENQYQRSTFVDFIMPQIIAISLLLSCFLLGSISVVREKSRKTIVRALMIPGALGNLVIGKIFSLVLLSFGQVGLIIIVAMALFGVKPPENMLMLVAGTTISSLVLSSIGVFIGFFARSESAAIQSCLLLAIPMLFLGNIIFSPDLLPTYTKILQQALPLSHITSVYKIIMITNGDPAGDMAALLSYFIILSGFLAFIVTRRKDITNYT